MSDNKNIENLATFRGIKIPQVEIDYLIKIEESVGYELDFSERTDIFYMPSFSVENHRISAISLNWLRGAKPLPECITMLKHLKTLRMLNNHKLKSIPNFIFEISSLQKLVLQNLKLPYLPKSIGNLKNLVWLDVSDNCLTSLPDSIGRLTLLQMLILGNNQLISLPESIGNLNNLKFLSLKNNRLTSLPSSLQNMKSLKSINIQDNNFDNLCNLKTRLKYRGIGT